MMDEFVNTDRSERRAGARVSSPDRGAAADLWSQRADLSEILAHEPPGRPWFIDQIVELGRGNVLNGPGGSSKTRALYHFGIAGVIGRLPWNWTVASTGSSILVLTEDTRRDLHQTLYPMCRALGVTEEELEQINQHLHVLPLAGEDFRLLDMPDGRTLDRTGRYDQLREMIDRLGNTVFVGLDPAIALTAGNELDQNHQRMLGKAVDDLAVKTQATVMLTSHATKGSLSQDELSSHSSRGGGAITDKVRGEYVMRTMTAKEAKAAGITDPAERKRHVQLVGVKGNNLPPESHVPVWLQRGFGGTLHPAEFTLDEANKGVTPGDEKALSILVRMYQGDTTEPPRLAEWRSECAVQGIISSKTEDAKKKAMGRVTKNLSVAGLIQQGEKHGTWVPTEQGKKSAETT
jgi:hypothetical protein